VFGGVCNASYQAKIWICLLKVVGEVRWLLNGLCRLRLEVQIHEHRYGGLVRVKDPVVQVEQGAGAVKSVPKACDVFPIVMQSGSTISVQKSCGVVRFIIGPAVGREHYQSLLHGRASGPGVCGTVDGWFTQFCIQLPYIGHLHSFNKFYIFPRLLCFMARRSLRSGHRLLTRVVIAGRGMQGRILGLFDGHVRGSS
jgi:hypothetical protein